MAAALNHRAVRANILSQPAKVAVCFVHVADRGAACAQGHIGRARVQAPDDKCASAVQRSPNVTRGEGKAKSRRNLAERGLLTMIGMINHKVRLRYVCLRPLPPNNLPQTTRKLAWRGRLAATTVNSGRRRVSNTDLQSALDLNLPNSGIKK
jgi:hypothetical protein